MKAFILSLVIFSFISCNFTEFDPVTPEELYKHVSYLASDELMGREIGSPGISAAEEYIAHEFEKYGLITLPHQDDYFINFEIFEYKLDIENSLLEFSIDNNKYNALPGISYKPFDFSGMGNIKTEVVFAGYGITAPEYNWDDYENLDVKGKLVLILRNEPDSFHLNNPNKETNYTSHAYFKTKMENAVKHGASGIILFTVPLAEPANEDMRLKNFYSLYLKRNIINSMYPNYLSEDYFAVQISQEFAELLIKDSFGFDSAELVNSINSGTKPCKIKNKSIYTDLSLNRNILQNKVKARNVAGMLEGNGNSSNNKWIIIGAHHDHVGFFDGTGDTIYNGADDNASGTAGILELAEAYATSKEHVPYNIVFITFSSEEKHLSGSQYFVNLYRDIDIKYMINLDMIGRNPDKKLLIFYSSNNIDNIIETINNSTPNDLLTFDINISNYQANSDDISFYRQGIPTLSFFTGLHNDYHGTGDHADKLNYNRMKLICDFTYNFVNELEFTDG